MRDTKRFPPNDSSDHRYFPRWITYNQIRFQLDGDKTKYEGCTRDISCSGACVCISKRPRLGQKVKIDLQLSREKAVNLKGEVVWVEESQNVNQVGINFSETDDKIQEMILDHAFEINKNDLIRHWYSGWESPK